MREFWEIHLAPHEHFPRPDFSPHALVRRGLQIIRAEPLREVGSKDHLELFPEPNHDHEERASPGRERRGPKSGPDDPGPFSGRASRFERGSIHEGTDSASAFVTSSKSALRARSMNPGAAGGTFGLGRTTVRSADSFAAARTFWATSTRASPS